MSKAEHMEDAGRASGPALSARLAAPGPFVPRAVPPSADRPRHGQVDVTDPGFVLGMESAVIGTVLAFKDAVFTVSDILKPEHFLDHGLGMTWRLILEMTIEGRAVDLFSVRYRIDELGLSDIAPRQQELGQYAMEALRADHARTYALNVIEAAADRGLRTVVLRAQQIAAQPGSVSERYALIGEELSTSERDALGSVRKGPRPIGDAVETFMASLDRAQSSGEGLGIRIGFHDIDRLLGGIDPDDLIIIAGRPAMGKTALAMNSADNIAQRTGNPGLYFSGEMSTDQLLARLACARALVDSALLRNGQLSDADLQRLTRALAIIAEEELLIVDERGNPGIGYIEATARAEANRRTLSGIWVDHIQLMEVEGFVGVGNGNAVVGEITKRLKALAKSLKVPVFALSQLNRGVEQRENKRPRLADLRESGGIEQDADGVVFVYRDDYYYGAQSKFPGQAEAIVGKSRKGQTGTAYLDWAGQYSLFRNDISGRSNQAADGRSHLTEF